MGEKTKRISIIIGTAAVLFLAAFLGALLAFQSYEPQIKVLLEDRAEWDGSQAIEGAELIIYGTVAKLDGDLLTVETEPPENPFIEWQKELTVSVTENTEIVFGEWKTTHEIIEEQSRFFQENSDLSQFQYNFLKETVADFDDLEIGRNILMVPEMDDPDSEYLKAAKIIIGKPR